MSDRCIDGDDEVEIRNKGSGGREVVQFRADVDQARAVPVLPLQLRELGLGGLAFLQAEEIDVGVAQRSQLRERNVSAAVRGPVIRNIGPEAA